MRLPLALVIRHDCSFSHGLDCSHILPILNEYFIMPLMIMIEAKYRTVFTLHNGLRLSHLQKSSTEAGR